MICAIHQPQYLAWLGYLDKMARCDVFIYLDDVQFKKNEWQNRNRIKTVRGPQWITVPVLHDFGQKISDVKINNTADWRRTHPEMLRQNYGKAPQFGSVWPEISGFYARDWDSLCDLNIALIEWMCARFGIKCRRVRSSQMSAAGQATERLVSLCRAAGADTYLSGVGGRDYLKQDKFAAAGIKLVFQEFKHPVYTQQYGEFVPGLSAVDLLFNEGPRAADILRG